MTLSNEAAREILRGISLSGAAEKEKASTEVIIGDENKLQSLITFSFGVPRLKRGIKNKFLSHNYKPIELEVISNLEIRCSKCREVITYPCMLMKQEYVVNIIYYFLCSEDFEELS